MKKLSELRPADYKADIYVLSLFKHQDPTTLDILNLDQWCFWVLPKDRIKEITNNGNSVSLNRLQKFGLESVGFNELADKINSLKPILVANEV